MNNSEIHQHKGGVFCLLMIDEYYLLSSGEDAIIKLWNIKNDVNSNYF